MGHWVLLNPLPSPRAFSAFPPPYALHEMDFRPIQNLIVALR